MLKYLLFLDTPFGNVAIKLVISVFTLHQNEVIVDWVSVLLIEMVREFEPMHLVVNIGANVTVNL